MILETDEITKVDKSGMYDLVKGFNNQLKEGKAIAEGAGLSKNMMDGVTQVVIVGMGGSAIAGDLVRCFSQTESPVPVSVVRNYDLPANVDNKSLVIASSFSGNTEETLNGLNEALRRGAKILCITSGGQVGQIAAENELAVVKIPGGMPPRAALGYSLSVLLVVANALGIANIEEAAWEESFRVLGRLIEEYSDVASNHQARSIAEELKDKLPVIYSATGMLETVNVRWRGQIQENAKMMACGNIYPELNHNEIMGWQSAGSGSLHEKMGVVVLRDKEDNQRNQHRMEVTRTLLEEKAGYWVEVQTQGEHRLTRMLSAICLGDWVSLYLALIRSVDPTPIELINKLKEALSKV
ncbi:MAG: bifunctional phosphoglucose/phosphomannose isomerase [Rhodothermaceae bacterium]|nr:bifunctional phosphoglucose/phosphomannose isomerase [Rhodothermaceae bacterium]